jgi:monoamine oxidase
MSILDWINESVPGGAGSKLGQLLEVAYTKVGQYTRFAGVEREPEGNIHFAGELTSVDFQGYLNGAVETGQRAAQELLSA